MATDPSTVGGPADLGKGLFGYRRSDVQQLIADRDLVVKEAERRMRASGARINELERSLAQAERRNAHLDEQLSQLQTQMDVLSTRSAGVERLAAQVRAEAERVSTWRKRLQFVAGAMTPAVERFRLLLEQVPDRVQEALTPAAVNASSLLVRLEEWPAVAARLEIDIPDRSA